VPLIAVNLSDKLLQDIRTLVDSGRYATLESFIEIGAFNQLALERGSSPAEIIERGHRRGSQADERIPQGLVIAKRESSRNGAHAGSAKSKRAVPKTASKVDVTEPVTEVEAKNVFVRFMQPTKPVATALPMSAETQNAERIFGQVNRIFPFKLVCRWLATAAANDQQWPKFTSVSARLADDAGTIGSLLDQWDNSESGERGSELATALPRRKNNASLDRFLSQFVARVTRASEISPGAVCQYGFARFEDATLALTEQGVEFAKLKNPILDDHDRHATTSLSSPETDFLITHIRKWVPTEWSDMRSAIMAVKSGKVSPTEVATVMRADLPGQWTDSMVQTHVSGVIARLTDIRLLGRTWLGRNVQYQLGPVDSVKKFLDSNIED
jgi:hypothetical protein